MDFNFELILTIAFLATGCFWLINRFLTKKEDGVIEFFASLAPVLGFRVNFTVFYHRALSNSFQINGSNP